MFSTLKPTLCDLPLPTRTLLLRYLLLQLLRPSMKRPPLKLLLCPKLLWKDLLEVFQLVPQPRKPFQQSMGRTRLSILKRLGKILLWLKGKRHNKSRPTSTSPKLRRKRLIRKSKRRRLNRKKNQQARNASVLQVLECLLLRIVRARVSAQPKPVLWYILLKGWSSRLMSSRGVIWNLSNRYVSGFHFSLSDG